MKPTEAMNMPAIKERFEQFLARTDPPASFKASELAQDIRLPELAAMGYKIWQEAVPAVIELAFEMRETGDCELIKGGKVLGDDVSFLDVGNAVRIRRTV